ncbi:antitoxin [Variovorax sp. KK3]|uniref:antitoxin n=1 Tax=Variovorax sp. KK3 TaxID=1855728 RepID=UPI00097C4336|nr:AbrB/MazE/SpoVT family DNA-binding domain-containing protein [Variovorax sp. KK3]
MIADPSRTARLFTNGGSQAVRLPAEFRFDGEEVYIRRDARSGEVVLSPKTRKSWANFVVLREQMRAELTAEGLDSLMRDREDSIAKPPQRDPFEGWQE